MQSFTLERPILSVDVVICRINAARLETLLQRRREEPYQDIFTLPGVAVRVDETLQQAAQRILREKVAWTEEMRESVYFEQLATFDGLYRDPRGRTISVAYLGLARETPELNRLECAWRPVAEISHGSLPFDHDEIIETARKRLQGKLRYTNIAKAFLADTFRIDQLQEVYEAILGDKLNRTNFRVKLLKIGLIELVEVLTEAVGEKGGRPPHTYRFTQKLLKVVERDFL